MALSLRWSVSILFVATVILVTALSTAYGVSRASDEVRTSIVERQQRSGTSTATSLGYLLDASKQSLIATAALIPASDLRDPTRTSVGPLLDPLIAAGREFRLVSLLDENGNVLVRRPEIDPPSDLGASQAFRQASAENRAVPAFDPRLGSPLWIVPVPASAPNLPERYLLGQLNPYFLEDILFSNIELEAEGVLLNEAGELLTGTDPAYNESVLAEWTPFDDIGPSRPSAEAVSPVTGDGVIVTATSMIPRYPLRVGILSSKAQLDALESGLIQSAVLTGLALAIPAALLGILATTTILRPVKEVRSATHRMREGDLEVRANPRGAKELRELAEDFNAMAGTLSREWQERVRLQNHLEELVKQRTQQLDQRQQDMEMFFYGVSHDFKSPVISIANITQMLEEALRDPRTHRDDLRGLAKRIQNSSLSLQTLIGELLEFAQADRVAPKYQLIGTKELVSPVLEEAQAQAGPRGIRIDALVKPFQLETDPERVRHIVSNLLGNAIKYMPEQVDPRVDVSVQRRSGDLVIRVADNGAGIPPEVQKQLFRPFARHQSTGSKVAGTGLGLSIVKRLTESLGGSVTLDTRVGRGTTFLVRLPVKPSPRGNA